MPFLHRQLTIKGDILTSMNSSVDLGVGYMHHIDDTYNNYWCLYTDP